MEIHVKKHTQATKKQASATPTTIAMVNPDNPAGERVLYHLMKLENVGKSASKRVTWETAKTNPRNLTKAQAVARVAELRKSHTWDEAFKTASKKPAPVAKTAPTMTKAQFIAMAKQFGFALK